MQLQDIFSPATFKLNLEAEDKDEVFEELVTHLTEANNIDNRDEIIAAVREREAKMSTGVQHGIAVPHGKADAVPRLMGVVGISPQGVDYDALDNQPVHLIFLLVSPVDDTGPHLKMLRNIAILLQSPQFYPDMLAAKTPEQAHRTLCRYEDTLGVQEA
jgi:PTS system fructose-specific IIC component/PTS system nitrogen regulatory IIA component